MTKNVVELYKADGTIATAYDYTPYGSVTASGIDQPIQWSSEHYDPELALVYYNYRRYNPLDGRWNNRDPIAEEGGRNLYGFVGCRTSFAYDCMGLNSKKCCWPDVTEWFRLEITELHKILQEKVKSKSLAAYAIWLLKIGLRIQYKSHNFDPANKCNSEGECKDTVTLGNYCIHRSELGNIVFGYISGYFPIHMGIVMHGLLKLEDKNSGQGVNSPADAGGIASGYYLGLAGENLGKNAARLLIPEQWPKTLENMGKPPYSEDRIRNFFEKNIKIILVNYLYLDLRNLGMQ